MNLFFVSNFPHPDRLRGAIFEEMTKEPLIRAIRELGDKARWSETMDDLRGKLWDGLVKRAGVRSARETEDDDDDEDEIAPDGSVDDHHPPNLPGSVFKLKIKLYM